MLDAKPNDAGGARVRSNEAGDLTYEQAQALMPEGWTLWGNFGDGKWRAGKGNQESDIAPAETIREAVERALTAAGALVLSVNPSTATFQLAGHQATAQGYRPGSGEWWAASRRIRAGWHHGSTPNS